MGILMSSKHQYIQNACKQSPSLEWRVLSWWMVVVVLEEVDPLISNGGFGSSLGPPAIASSCWTGLPPVGFSSPWSRGTTGDPSTASSWRPGTREGTTEWERLRSKMAKKKKKKGETGRGKITVIKRGWSKEAGENRERHREAWHGRKTDRMTNTNKYQPLASFHMSASLFSLLLHFTCKHCGRRLQSQYYGRDLDKSRDLQAFPSVSVHLKHNNCCCYPLSLVIKKTTHFIAGVRNVFSYHCW